MMFDSAMLTRRDFAAMLAAAGTAGVLAPRGALADEGPPESTTLRLCKIPGICVAPQYVAEELLRGEGFTEVRYLPTPAGTAQAAMVARGEADMSLNFVSALLPPIDAGASLRILGGVHPGCFELFAAPSIRRVTDLKGRSVGVLTLGSSAHLFLASIFTYVGMDPSHDINWVANPDVKPMELFATGKIDAFLGFPPEPQQLRARKIGEVILNSAIDHPWSQYFCCMLSANARFVERNPVATKRALRAILKAADLCVIQPDVAARQMVEHGFTAGYDFALQSLVEVPYRKWRDYDPEDSIRFYALRLHEAGVIKSNPNKIIADGTDWRFFNELKRELKA